MEWENNYFQIKGGEHSLKLTQKTGGVIIVPIYLTRFLLIKIKRADGQFHWEFPRGFTERGEPKEVAALRELDEELNIDDAKVIKDLGKLMPDSGLINSNICIYEVKINSLDNVKLQHSEHIVDYRLVELSDLETMITKGIVIDGFTISGLCKWKMQTN